VNTNLSPGMHGVHDPTLAERRPARVERVQPATLDCLTPLVADGERHGVRFVRRLADEWATGANRFDRPGEGLFMAWIEQDVVGVGGLNIDPYAMTREVGRVRHLYVLAAHRRAGIGERLVRAIVDAASGRFEILRLRTSNPEAARLYERLGFARVDADDCTHTLAPGRPAA
jgi:GNAT superfamily N-acetyltransferase